MVLVFDVRHLAVVLAVAGGANPLLSACSESAFVCLADEQCSGDAHSGVCQPNGYCSFPDEDCASGQRYGQHAGKGLAGSCVSEADDADDDAADSTTTSSSTSSSSTSGSTSMGTSSAVTSSPDSGEASSTADSSEPTGDPDDGHTSDTTTSVQTTDDGATDEDTNTTGSPIPCAFEDDFEAGTLPAGWGAGGDLDIVVQDGMLGMQLSPSPAYGWAYSINAMDLTGSEVIAEIGSPPPPSSNAQLLIELSTPTLSYVMLVEGSELIARTSTGGASYTTHAAVSFDLDDTRFVRLSDLGGAIGFAYSDGVTWTTLTEVPIGDGVDITMSKTSITGGTWQQESEVGFVGVEWFAICP
jgi:hypothetical protein